MNPRKPTAPRPGSNPRRPAGPGILVAILAIAWMLAPPAPAAAQAGTDGAQVTAVVLGELTVVRLRNLAFGTVLVGSGQTDVAWDAEGDVRHPAEFRVVGDWAGGGYDFSWNLPQQLVDDDSGEAIDFTLRASYYAGNGCEASVVHLAEGTAGVNNVRLRCRHANTAYGNGKAEARVFFWGNITVPPGTPPGDYSATVSLTVER